MTGKFTAGTVAAGNTIVLGVATYAQLLNALTTCGSNQCALYISGAIAPTANLTIPANVQLIFQGGQIQPASGTTTTINGPITSPPVQIFGGSGSIAGLFVSEPEWFGGTTSSYMLSAGNALSVYGGTIRLQDLTTYVSPWTGSPSSGVVLSKAHVHIVGGAQPDYNSTYTSLTSGTGTIVFGQITMTGDYPIVENLGVDASTSCQDGIAITNATGTGAIPSALKSPVIKNVSVVLKSGCANHGVLVENTVNGYADNVRAVGGYYGEVIKSSKFTARNIYACGNSSTGIYVKADSNFSGSIYGVSIDGALIDAACGMTSTGLSVEAQSAVIEGVNISNYTNNSASWGLGISGGSSSTPATDININNYTSNQSGFTCGNIYANSARININNVVCNASSNVGFIDSGGTTSFNNVQVTNSPVGGFLIAANHVRITNSSVENDNVSTTYGISMSSGDVTVSAFSAVNISAANRIIASGGTVYEGATAQGGLISSGFTLPFSQVTGAPLLPTTGTTSSVPVNTATTLFTLPLPASGVMHNYVVSAIFPGGGCPYYCMSARVSVSPSGLTLTQDFTATYMQLSALSNGSVQATTNSVGTSNVNWSWVELQ